jgi:hypothetical protein
MSDTKGVAFRFSTDPRCLLRIVHGQSPRALVLADGARIAAGDVVLKAHLWNEHLPSPSDEGLTRGFFLLRDGQTSLQQLARFLESRPDLDEVRAIYGEVGFLSDDRLPQARRIAARLGFELIAGERPGWNPFQTAFWRNIESWRLLRRFNPAGLERTGFAQLRRCEAWLSREQLLARYGPAHAAVPVAHAPTIVADELPLLHRPATVAPALAGVGD